MMKLSKIHSTKISREDNMKLKYYILNNSNLLKFDLKKDASNLSTNQLALNAIIGTLVKYGPTGRIEPYLAERWEVSDESKTWKFIIRDNIFCEDGEPITAELFHQSLLKSFKEYRTKKSAIMFDYLVGWDDFYNQRSESIEGFKFNNNTLEFHFIHYPDEILELLRMPYFGIWRYDKNDQIISSSAYQLTNQENSKVELKLREGWFSNHQNSFKEVEIKFLNEFIYNDKYPSDTIFQMPFETKEKSINNQAYWIHFPPTLLDTFVLSPYKNGFFKNIENRRTFSRKVKSLPQEIINSKDFYPSAPSRNKHSFESSEYGNNSDKSTLTFILEKSNYSKNEIETLKEIISRGLENSGHDFEIINRDLGDKNMLNNILSNKEYDARISSVNIGAHPVYTAIKMMFCTKLGINFPGHEQKFCEMIEDNLRKGLQMNEDFINKFNDSLDSEAIIIPIAHKSQSILVSRSIDPLYLPATTPYPLFEKLKKINNE